MYQYIIYIGLAPLALLAVGLTLVLSLKHDKTHRFWALDLFLMFSALWILLSVLEILSPSPQYIMVFSHITYSFIAFCPVFWFLFTKSLSGKKQNLLKPFLFLSIIPFFTSILAFTPQGLHLLWKQDTYINSGPFLIHKVLAYGPWFWVHFTYSYLLFFASTFIVLKEFFPHHQFYQKQATLILLGNLVPLAANLIYVLRLIPGLTKDFSPLVITFSAVFLTYAIKKFYMMDLAFPSRQRLYKILERKNAYLVLNHKKIVVDISPYAEEVLKKQNVIGEPLENILPMLKAYLYFDLFEQKSLPVEITIHNQPFILMVKNLEQEEQRWLLLLQHPDNTQTEVKSTILSKREIEILALRNKGLTQKEIAAQLFVSENTVKTHLHNINKKARIKNLGAPSAKPPSLT